jgi:hypothetical protein
MAEMKWMNELQIQEKVYVCAYCSAKVGPDKGLFTQVHPRRQVFIYFCSYCGQPTYFDDQGRQFPGVRFGEPVNHLPNDVAQLYDEARGAMSAQAYTPAVLACRKILMNVAVSLGANAGNSFVSYVQFLAEQGYIPPNGKHWVDHIRIKSNEANHEIAMMSKDEAEKLITFVQMMLKFIYELPNVVPAPVVPAPAVP